MNLTKDVLNEILALALVYQRGIQESTAESKHDSERAALDAERALHAYLNTLEHEVLLDVISMMYLGKNKRYGDVADGMQRFYMVRQDHENKWDNKEFLINQITEKYMLHDYLCNAADIMKST
ncbi:MAG: hypothetical protein ACI4Q4_05775 [Oscillospiraceae bacterium]